MVDDAHRIGSSPAAAGLEHHMNTPHVLSSLLADHIPLTPSLAFIQNLSGWELIVILVIALLLFGRRLPEVGKSLGKGIVEFKKGIKGIEDEVDDASNRRGSPERPIGERGEYTTPNSATAERPYRAPIGPSGSDPRVSRNDRIDDEVPSPGVASTPPPAASN
jgi:TatA/E family protein of Tat protein translocase